jgi:large subunit ribosomal protein L15
MSLLNSLFSIVSKSKKRVGRGGGSGKGFHTAGRGQKGQNSRNGGKRAQWFEGGQLPLIKRLPMQRGKGKFNVVRPTVEVTLSELNKMKATEVTLDTLKLEKVIDADFKKAKIIATGTLTRKVTLKGVRASQGAIKAIEQAGGSVEA